MSLTFQLTVFFNLNSDGTFDGASYGYRVYDDYVLRIIVTYYILGLFFIKGLTVILLNNIGITEKTT
ncbi:MAG: hypothetical protein VR72_08560 [Clostridiaceae bacterium BRH_c20a]|nr:MAG: hypothetical protein VR72_08560 [Clostridiaceae bacterium BRH_c20a]